MNSQENFDLIVIGAGATGSCIALEASKRGLNVALFDAGDIGSGTSCRSTKLLHGGVRYLEIAFKKFDLSQLKLVREALIERGHWINEAPFLAHELELAIPSENCFDKAYYGSGLKVYDTLSGDKGISKSRFISKSEINENFPFLKKCAGGVAYSDGQFDDARLNLLIALTAEKAGTLLANYKKVIDFEYAKDGKLSGIITQDQKGQNQRWRSKVIVNATGIHVDTLRLQVDSSAEERIIISKGVHIVLEENLCPKGKGLLLPATDDGRVLFVLPFFNHTLIGTTDTPCAIREACKTTFNEEQYLINHLKNLFPKFENPKVTSSWSGGRPLLKPRGAKNSSQIVREHEIEVLPCGLISAMGGKWTTCRKIALDTLEKVESVIGETLPKPKSINIIGSHPNPSKTKAMLESQSNELREILPKTNLINKQINHLQSKYGINALAIMQGNSEENRKPISSDIPLCRAEIDQDINHEHAKTATDILSRRNRLATVNIEEAERILPIVNEHLSKNNLAFSELNLEK